MKIDRLARAFAAAPLALSLTLAVAFAPLTSARAAEMTPEQRQAIETIVHDYIVKHPEVLQEAMVELEKRQQDAQRQAQQKALETEKTALLSAANQTVVGNPKGDVTLIEFFDYNCGYCKRALGDVAELAKDDPKLRIVLKDFPVLGPDSLEASRVALAVRQQLPGEKFFDYHTKLMATKGRVGKEQALAVAKDMGLDMAKIAKDGEAAEIQAAIDETIRLGDKLGLTGTPSFIVGDEVVSGAVGAEPLKQLVASVRKCGKASCTTQN